MGGEGESGGKEQTQRDKVREGGRKRKENMAEEGMRGSAWEYMNKRRDENGSRLEMGGNELIV